MIKHIPQRLFLSACACLALAGCDGNPNTDNGHVEVHNHTDQNVVLTYRQEVQIYGGVDIRTFTDVLPVGQKKTIYVDSALYDGELQVEYNSTIHVYDLDFDLFGFETVYVNIGDFPPPVLPSGIG